MYRRRGVAMAKRCLKDEKYPSYQPFEFGGSVSSLSKIISRSGMLCRTPMWIDEMTLLDIKFQLPDTGNGNNAKVWVECRGVVLRCERKDPGAVGHPYEVEIFFHHISEKDRNLLADYVAAAG